MTRKEIGELVEAKDEASLEALLGSRMTFGTAGNFTADDQPQKTPMESACD